MAKIIYLDHERHKREQQARQQRSERHKHVSFNRAELNIILNIYSQKVGLGEWKDYAIDSNKQQAIFSIYNKAHQVPLFQIVKRASNLYFITAQNGCILKKSNRLENLVHIFRHHLKIVS